MSKGNLERTVLCYVILLVNLFCNLFGQIQVNIYPKNNVNIFTAKKFINKPAGINGTDIVPLYKHMNVEYYGTIGLGHPSKPFNFAFDTTFADTMVASKQCGLQEIACLIHNQYDHTQSSTYQPIGNKVNLTSENYSIRGFLSMDNFHLGHMILRNQTFVEATHLSYKPFIYRKVDGIVGLGFIKSAVSQKNPFMYNLIKQGLSEPVFTFYFNRDATTEHAGRLILGGTERKHVKNGNLFTLPIIGNKNYWKVKMNRLIINDNTNSYVFGENSEAYFDTSRHSILGPEDDIVNINNYLGAMDVGFGNYIINCQKYAKLPNITITLNDYNFTISSKYYIQKMSFQGIQACFSPFNSVKGIGSSWFLGGAFLMQFYTEYDYNTDTVKIGETVF